MIDRGRVDMSTSGRLRFVREWLAGVILLSGVVAGCRESIAPVEELPVKPVSRPEALDPRRVTETRVVQEPALEPPPIVAAAREQVGTTLVYDPAYVGLKYPGGDVPVDRGVCTDVVVRALRTGMGMDLQQLVHEDMKAAFSQYPKEWGLRKPDRNIDHRRVANLRKYFERRKWALEVTTNREDYLPGDLVTCVLEGNRPHIMIVSDKKTPGGIPLVIHNIGAGAQEEDRLFEFPLTGHYRIVEQEQTPPAAHPHAGD